MARYCSEPRLAFNRTVVLRYRIHFEQRGYAPATVNLRLAAVRRIAYEAADAGLLSPELAAGVRRVKGVRRIGVRLGNWLTPEQGRRLLEAMTLSSPRELRDQAMVAMLIGCGLRRALVEGSSAVHHALEPLQRAPSDRAVGPSSLEGSCSYPALRAYRAAAAVRSTPTQCEAGNRAERSLAASSFRVIADRGIITGGACHDGRRSNRALLEA